MTTEQISYRLGYSQTLRAIDACYAPADELGWRATEQAFATVLASDDLREGITAFAEKRPPRWQGR